MEVCKFIKHIKGVVVYTTHGGSNNYLTLNEILEIVENLLGI